LALKEEKLMMICTSFTDFLEKTEKHQENEANDQEFNSNHVKGGNFKYS
jgi:hypothetical protein